MIYDIRMSDVGPWEYRDSEGNILQVEDSSIELENSHVQEALAAVGYDGPADWESA